MKFLIQLRFVVILGIHALLFHEATGFSALQHRQLIRTLSLQNQNHLSAFQKQRHHRWLDPVKLTNTPSIQRHSPNSSWKLHSLSKLVEDTVATTLSSKTANNKKKKKTILVGGKGGVGKTTVSSALAVHLASEYSDLNILVVSTDPAHSLGDALDEELRSTHGHARVLTDPVTAGRLSAMEVDASAALEEFRNNLEAFDIQRLADALGVSTDMLESFGLQEFSGLLNNPPPGLDELVALSNVLADDDGDASIKYDVVIVDTAPTGHTLRLLALPQFLDGLLGKLIKLRMKLSGTWGRLRLAKQRCHSTLNQFALCSFLSHCFLSLQVWHRRYKHSLVMPKPINAPKPWTRLWIDWKSFERKCPI
jgi:anion-transporting  ArsA/GET3 family ATPase